MSDQTPEPEVPEAETAPEQSPYPVPEPEYRDGFDDAEADDAVDADD